MNWNGDNRSGTSNVVKMVVIITAPVLSFSLLLLDLRAPQLTDVLFLSLQISN